MLRWWNASVAVYNKAADALQQLRTWTADVVMPGSPPIPIPPAVDIWDAVCEAQGNHWSFGGMRARGLARGPATVLVPPADPAAWLAVRPVVSWRQYGYFGKTGAPAPGVPVGTGMLRYDKNIDAAWPGGVAAPWLGYPPAVPHPTGWYAQPNYEVIRRYPSRRELVLQSSGPLSVYWYHAYSGGHEGTAYDLLDALTLIMLRATSAVPAVRCVAVLCGDLNYWPLKMQTMLAAYLPGMVIPPPDFEVNVGPNEIAILATGLPTFTADATPSELDYAVIYHFDPTGMHGVYAAIERGDPPAAPPFAGYPYSTPMLPLPSAPGAAVAVPLPPHRTSDHHPIRVLLNY